MIKKKIKIKKKKKKKIKSITFILILIWSAQKFHTAGAKFSHTIKRKSAK